MLGTGGVSYERLQDKARFAIRQEENGTYTITCQVNGDQFGWPVPGPSPAIQGLPDAATAEAILTQLRQMDIAAHAQLLFQFNPKPVNDTAPAEEPTFKKGRHV